MKKFLLTNLLVVSAGVYGASIDHIQTYSPDYLSNQAQTGMINAVSGNYNPAGTTRLEKGKYVHAGIQYAFGKETMSYNGKEHSADLRQPVPNIALISVDDKGAWFANFGGIAGGGELKYHGIAGLDAIAESKTFSRLGVSDNGTVLTGSNKYEQITLGRAFNVNEKLSFSGAIRFIHGTRELKGNIDLAINPKDPRTKGAIQALAPRLLANGLQADIDAKREAYGVGFQLGMNYKVNEKLNIGARYDSRIKLNFKSKGHENLDTNVAGLAAAGVIPFSSIGVSTFYPQYKIGDKIRRDLPAILSLGASYQATDRWLVSAAGNFYFNRQAKMDRGLQGHSTKYKNGWEIALGNEFKLNDKFTLIGSVNYARTGAASETYSDVEFAINSVTLGAGLRYSYDETLDITASIAHFMYDKSEGTYKEKYNVAENQKYDKKITALGLSITKKF